MEGRESPIANSILPPTPSPQFQVAVARPPPPNLYVFIESLSARWGKIVSGSSLHARGFFSDDGLLFIVRGNGECKLLFHEMYLLPNDSKLCITIKILGIIYITDAVLWQSLASMCEACIYPSIESLNYSFTWFLIVLCTVLF